MALRPLAADGWLRLLPVGGRHAMHECRRASRVRGAIYSWLARDPFHHPRLCIHLYAGSASKSCSTSSATSPRTGRLPATGACCLPSAPAWPARIATCGRRRWGWLGRSPRTQAACGRCSRWGGGSGWVMRGVGRPWGGLVGLILLSPPTISGCPIRTDQHVFVPPPPVLQDADLKQQLELLQVRLDALPQSEWGSVQDEVDALKHLTAALEQVVLSAVAGDIARRAAAVQDPSVTGAAPSALQIVAVGSGSGAPAGEGAAGSH